MAADLIHTATLVDLVDALAEDALGRFAAPDGREFFRCPRCGHDDDRSNPGRAVTLGADRWHCTSCRWFGTRWQLERLVLEDAIALDRLLLAAAEANS